MSQESTESSLSLEEEKVSISPKCKYFGNCGGCTAQHIPYELQLENSKKMFSNMFNFPEEKVEVYHDSEYNYRNRMDFIVHSGGLGLRKKGQWDKIIDIENCEIAMPKVNDLLLEVRKFLLNLETGIDYFDLHKQTGSMKYCLIRVSKAGDSCVSFTLNENSSTLKDAIETVKKYAAISSANNVLISYVPKERDQSISLNYLAVKGEEYLHEEFLGLKYMYSAMGFFQNNPVMAEKLVAYVKDLFLKHDSDQSDDSNDSSASRLKNIQLLDLYGGVGTFGIALSDLFEKVYVMELFEPSIEIAKKNIAENGLTNVEALVGDVKQFRKLGFDEKKETYVLVDPPRSGIVPKALQRLKELAPPVLIYVSCNPKQLAKDLMKLETRYELKSCALFDLFPQTPHMEAVVELVRKE